MIFMWTFDGILKAIGIGIVIILLLILLLILAILKLIDKIIKKGKK